MIKNESVDVYMKVMNSSHEMLTDRKKMFHIQKYVTVFGVLLMRY
jgi:hypothetical protein